MPRFTRVIPEDEVQLLYPHCVDCNARHALREMWGEVCGSFALLICEKCKQKREKGEEKTGIDKWMRGG